jgi:hypothetical protein
MRQKDDVVQVPRWGLTNVRRHPTKFNRHGELVSGNCAPVDGGNGTRLSARTSVFASVSFPQRSLVIHLNFA